MNTETADHSITVQAHLQHYTEPSTDPIPATSNLSSTTLLPLGPGTFTHNTAGIPIIITCTKADLIDEGSDLVAGSSGMGGMVKGKGGEWEERTDGVMQILRTIALKCKRSSHKLTLLLIKDIHRWSGAILYHTPSSNSPSPTAIRPPPAFHTSGPTTNWTVD